MRIDLFVAAGCPSCGEALRVVEGFAGRTMGVEVHLWDLSGDPGPAVGRGIFAAPTLLIDEAHTLPGVPRADDLARYLEPVPSSTIGGTEIQEARASDPPSN